MDLEKLVLSVEQMQHLKELGLKVEYTAMAFYPPCHYDERHRPYYLKDDERRYNVAINDGEMLAIPTLTLQEILELLPEKIWIGDDDYKVETIGKHYICYYSSSAVNKLLHGAWEIRLIDAAYNLLCWCAENKYLDIKYYEVGTTQAG